METPSVAPGAETSSHLSAPIPAAPGGLARRYAVALYELASEERTLDHVVDQADGLGRLIDQSLELRAFLACPTLDVAQSRTAVIALLDRQGFGSTIRHFAGVIANNRRLPALRAIVAAFARLVAERRGITVAEVASAHALGDVQRTQLRARLAEAGFGRVDIHETVDTSLLGGLVVRVGARLYDTSVKSRLARLNHAMKGAA